MHIKEKNNNERGSLMIEAMVAISLVLIGLVGIFSLVSRSMHLNNDVRNRFTATYLASSGLEIVKNIIDTDIAITQQTGTGVWNTTVTDGSYELQYNTDRSNFAATKIGTVLSSRPLLLDPATGIYSYDSGSVMPFTRTVTVSTAGGKIMVEAVVIWKEDGKEQRVNLADVFTDWRG